MKARRGSTWSPISIENTSDRGRGVLHRDLRQRAGGRIHRGLTQFGRIHLAEALEPVVLDAALGDRQDRLAQLVEGGGVLGVLAQPDVERRRADQRDELLVHLGKRLVLLGLERGARDAMGGGQAGLRLDRADHHVVIVLGHQLGAVGLAVLAVLGDVAHQRVDVGDLLLEQSRLLQERDHPVTVRRAQGRGPAVVLLEQPVEALPARVGELELLARAVVHLDLLELVAEQDVLELGLALDVAVLLALGQPVQRRLGDVHVAGLDQGLHLAEEQRQGERADVGAVDVGVGQQHDLVVARLGDVELVAHAGADRGDECLDLLVLEDLVDPALLDVEDLAAQRQDRLGAAVPRADRRPAGRVALHDEQLRQRRVLDRAVGQLAGQG